MTDITFRIDSTIKFCEENRAEIIEGIRRSPRMYPIPSGATIEEVWDAFRKNISDARMKEDDFILLDFQEWLKKKKFTIPERVIKKHQTAPGMKDVGDKKMDPTRMARLQQAQAERAETAAAEPKKAESRPDLRQVSDQLDLGGTIVVEKPGKEVTGEEDENFLDGL